MSELSETERAAIVDAIAGPLDEHAPCEWEQVGPCVYCKNHGVRLYQGALPPDRNPARQVCEEFGHAWDDANSMCQAGFYYLCRRCGEQEWTE